MTLHRVAGGDKDGEVDDNGVDERCGGDAGRGDDGVRGWGRCTQCCWDGESEDRELWDVAAESSLLVVLATSNWKMSEGFFLAIQYTAVLVLHLDVSENVLARFCGELTDAVAVAL